MVVVVVVVLVLVVVVTKLVIKIQIRVLVGIPTDSSDVDRYSGQCWSFDGTNVLIWLTTRP